MSRGGRKKNAAVAGPEPSPWQPADGRRGLSPEAQAAQDRLRAELFQRNAEHEPEVHLVGLTLADCAQLVAGSVPRQVRRLARIAIAAAEHPTFPRRRRR